MSRESSSRWQNVVLYWLALIGPPSVWITHLSVDYLIASFACDLGNTLRLVAIVATTIVSLLLVFGCAQIAVMRWGRSGSASWRDLEDDPGLWFFGVRWAVLLSVLFGAGIILEASTFGVLHAC